MERLLDTARIGPFHLRQPEIADMVVEASQYNCLTLNHYELHAFAVMPNHVHLLVTSKVPLPILTKSLKNITARRANAMLGQTGAFWQDESFDREVRNHEEFNKIRRYIENNPAKAGLVTGMDKYPWSSCADLVWSRG